VTACDFEAVIYRSGILRAVDVPDRFADEVRDWDYPPVVVTVAGVERATTLVPRAGGGLRLYLHTQLRKAAGADTGEVVRVALRLDEAPLLPVPDDLVAAVARVDRGPEALDLLPPGLRRQILTFVAEARSDAARRKRVAKMTELIARRAAKLAGSSPRR
jgi:hypothetical protein